MSCTTVSLHIANSNSSARAIRKTHFQCFLLLTQFLLLIIGRSAHSHNQLLIHEEEAQ